MKLLKIKIYGSDISQIRKLFIISLNRTQMKAWDYENTKYYYPIVCSKFGDLFLTWNVRKIEFKANELICSAKFIIGYSLSLG